MASEIALLFSLGVLLPLALILSLIFARLRLPTVPAQIVAGMALGPHGLALLTELETLNLLASLGIVFLMFFIGLELDPSELRRMGVKVVGLSILQMLIALTIGLVTAISTGFPLVAGLVIGSIMGLSSTAILSKLLLERGGIRDEAGHFIVGLSIVEDVLAIFLILLLPKLAVFGTVQLQETLRLIFQGLLLLGVILLFSLTVAPWLIDLISQFEVEFPEITLLGAVSLGIFFSYISAILGFSPAIGAFLTGLMIRGKQSRFLSSKVLPIKDLFIVLFFASMGTLIEPQSLLRESTILLILGLGAFVGKTLGAFVIWGLGSRVTSPLELGLILTPRGEFSLVLAREVAGTGAVNPSLVSITGGLTILTVLISALGLRITAKEPVKEEYKLYAEKERP